jgi:NodT family efflux transporter outer membrane factor (OMF) lipoprotein
MSRSIPDVRRATFAAAAVLLCASCAVGPDFHPPEPPAAGAYAPAPIATATAGAQGPQGTRQQIIMGERIRRDWWTLFRSRELDALIAQAFAANPTLDSAHAALRVAQENVAAQRGAFFPGVTAGYTFNRTKQGGAIPAASTATPADAGAGSIYTFHTAQLSVAYAPDVFGGNRRSVESLQAQAAAQRFQLDAAYVTLASNVVGAAVQDALLREQVRLVESMIASGNQSLALVRRQWQAGAVSHLDVSLQESALAQTRQQLPALRKQLAQNQDLLRVLLGAAPDVPLPAFDLDRLELPAQLPVALPSQLVEQRPDVQAAQEQLHAASAQIGVARAARLPQFPISAELGGGAARIADLFGPGGRFFSFIAGITQPVIDGGSLRHREAAARAAYDQAAAQYRSAVLAALQNVADALHAIEADAEALSVASDAVASAHTALELTRRQYGHGYLDRIALINAEQADRQATMGWLQARAARLADTSALFQAAGGGWSAQGNQ